MTQRSLKGAHRNGHQTSDRSRLLGWFDEYDISTFVAFDPAVPLAPGEAPLLVPNTTTLVHVILNRLQTDRLAVITGAGVEAVVLAGKPTPTGRAAIVESDQAGSAGV